MKINKIMQTALSIYTAVTFISLPILYLFPGKTPVFNYIIANFVIEATKNKNIISLIIAFALIALLAITAREVKYYGIVFPSICSLLFIVDTVLVIINATRIATYVSILFDLGFLVLLVLYFIKIVKKTIARKKR